MREWLAPTDVEQALNNFIAWQHKIPWPFGVLPPGHVLCKTIYLGRLERRFLGFPLVAKVLNERFNGWELC